jgi:hypothetical protein
MPVTVSAESVIFFVEGENECTSERLLGQFSIFGAVEENPRNGFSRIEGIKELGEDIWLGRVESGGSIGWHGWRKISGGVGGRIVHRRCTGNAEREGGCSQ